MPRSVWISTFLVSLIWLLAGDPALSTATSVPETSPEADFNYDIVIYGSSPAGITAAVQSKRMGKSVALVTPDQHLGGLTSSGLGWTDSKNGDAIGGIAREFYGKVYNYYLSDAAWIYETREQYLDKNIGAQPGPAIDTDKQVQWTFEPHVAEDIFETWLEEGEIPVFRDELVDRSETGVIKSANTITGFKTMSGKTFTGSQFIDAGYEGDLMAAAGISYSVGRDAASEYDESLAGKLIDLNNNYEGIDPYVQKGDPSSGLIMGIQDTIAYPTPEDFNGSADPLRVQSFNFRLPLTTLDENKVNVTAPSGYNVDDFEIVLRAFEAGHNCGFTDQLMPNLKTDSNADGTVSFDLVGGNYDETTNTTYSEATYDERQKMIANHKNYQQGFLYTLQHSDRVPADKRAAFAKWGYSADEFQSNNNWPYAIYIREARRMNGVQTLVQQDIQNNTGSIDGAVAGLGCYSLDSHVVRRLEQNGQIYDEGYFYVVTSTTPYPISYDVITPQKDEVTNLLNPVTFSASHVALGSARMEPTYMILGQTAATAAVFAIEQDVAVQDIDREKLTERLQQDNQTITV